MTKIELSDIELLRMVCNTFGIRVLQWTHNSDADDHIQEIQGAGTLALSVDVFYFDAAGRYVGGMQDEGATFYRRKS